MVSYSYQNNPIRFSVNGKVSVNATNMAKPFGGSKRPNFWLNLQQTNEFLIVLSKARNLALADLVQVRKGGSNPGTWMHEDVALEFARWLSPEFAIWCNDRIKELLLANAAKPYTKLTVTESELKRVLNKYNRQKVDTYLTPDEVVQMQQACKKFGYSSVYQLMQVLVRNFLDAKDAIREIKGLKDEVKRLQKERDTWQNRHNDRLAFLTELTPFLKLANQTINEERLLRKQTEQKLKQVKTLL